MNNITEEINIVYVIDFIKKNLIFSIFLPLIISIGYFFYQYNYNYLPSQKVYQHSKQFYVIDSKNSFDLSLLSESILKLNKIFDYAEFKLNFLFTDFILINAESSNDKIIYSENQFFEDISGSSDSSSNVNDMINDNFIWY